MAARSMAQAIFGGKPPDPKEQAKQWRLKIKGEMRQLERQIKGIEREEQKIVKEIKKAAKEGQMEPVKMLAKEVARSRKAKERILIAKTNLNSMEMQISSSMSMMRVSGAMEKSAELMKLMNETIKQSEVAAAMQELSKEMSKAGIIDEMIEEAFEDMDDDDLEEESSAQVEQVLAELGLAAAEGLPSAATEAPARPAAAKKPLVAAEPEQDEEDEDEEDLSEMQARIAALRAA